MTEHPEDARRAALDSARASILRLHRADPTSAEDHEHNRALGDAMDAILALASAPAPGLARVVIRFPERWDGIELRPSSMRRLDLPTVPREGERIRYRLIEGDKDLWSVTSVTLNLQYAAVPIYDVIVD